MILGLSSRAFHPGYHLLAKSARPFKYSTERSLRRPHPELVQLAATGGSCTVWETERNFQLPQRHQVQPYPPGFKTPTHSRPDPQSSRFLSAAGARLQVRVGFVDPRPTLQQPVFLEAEFGCSGHGKLRSSCSMNYLNLFLVGFLKIANMF